MSPQGLCIANSEATNELDPIQCSQTRSQMLHPTICCIYSLLFLLYYYQCTYHVTVHAYMTRTSTISWRLLNILNPRDEGRSEWEEHVTWEENPKLDSSSLLAERAQSLNSFNCTTDPQVLLLTQSWQRWVPSSSTLELDAPSLKGLGSLGMFLDMLNANTSSKLHV